MKLNNKGFAISTIMYMILVVGIVLIILTLSVLSNRKLILDKIRKETIDNVYRKQNNYKVVFHSNNESDETREQNFKYGKAQKLENNTFTNGNYLFTGWNTEPDGTGMPFDNEQLVNNLSDEENGMINLYAMWYGIIVTFDPSEGETSVISKVVQYDQNYGELPTPTREGYTFLGWSTNKISKTCKQLDYIESNGSQYIDTLYNPTSEKIKYEFKFRPLSSTIYGMVGNSSDDDKSFGLSFWGGKYYVGTSRKLLESTFTNGNDYSVTVQASSGALTNTINGSTKSTTYASNLYKNSSIGIFCTRTVSGWQSNKTTARLYFLKIYDNDKLVRDFMPCHRISDNVIGLYDIENDEFYTNVGTSAFNPGTVIEDYVYDTSSVSISNDHTLYAVWEKK